MPDLIKINKIPLSLYIHIPWCVKKCPYCDFNSHVNKDVLPEKEYIQSLIYDFKKELPKVKDREVTSIFFGGGTPSLFSAEGIKNILDQIRDLIKFSKNIEITLEANPGTVDNNHLEGYFKSCINRISVGAQSFQNDKLQLLGRIHDNSQILLAIEKIKQSGFNSFNIDLMYGLPTQTKDQALEDLLTAISLNPSHISWYNLTLEPNTSFYKRPPDKIPDNDLCTEILENGSKILKQNNFHQYEVSAFSKINKQCKHNLNYWNFGDYLGIGAGAHSKLTLDPEKIVRFCKIKNPKKYMLSVDKLDEYSILSKSDLVFEFMLNNLRLIDGFHKSLFEQRTGLAFTILESKLKMAVNLGLLQYNNSIIKPTKHGLLFLNNLQELFLPAIK